VPLDALSVPVLADQFIVLADTGEPLEVRVAVRDTEPPEFKVKLLCEIEIAVEDCIASSVPKLAVGSGSVNLRENTTS
jgi:hypothetical protein